MQRYKYLGDISSPEDVKKLPFGEIPELCDEIRSFLVDTVEKTGGHLASNLGAVELSVALHRIFDSPKDKIIFDVGHQSYVHKIITGRRERFSDLRKPGGLSGFTKRDESEHDPFGAGHSSTSLSAALGFAEANRLSGSDAYTVAVIGDGAYTGGMIHEALNNCRPDLRLIIVLNENGMSISQNRGAFASYLAKARMSEGYVSLKKKTKSFLSHIPLIGKPISKLLAFIKHGLKVVVYEENYFEELGLYYLGPLDGNDYKQTERALRDAKKLKQCVVVHLKTQKGRGYSAAEEQPDEFHSVYSGRLASTSFHGVFAEELTELAAADEKITAVTAAMGIGTGLDSFGKAYPERYFDVGIAEEHALTFSAGLAAAGYKPFVAIYSTFLQRGYDNISHDIALQKLPVRMMIDRAGLAPSDGATHHGIFDVAMLSQIPGISIYAPTTYESLKLSVMVAARSQSPIAVRYANSAESEKICAAFTPIRQNEDEPFIALNFDISAPKKYIFISYGNLCERVLAAEELLRAEGIDAGTVALEKLTALSDTVECLRELFLSAERVVFAEEGIKNGGAAMIFGEYARRYVKDYRIAAIDANFASPDTMCDIYDYVGLSPEKLAALMK